MSASKIIFLQAKTAEEKIQKITEIIHLHFNKKESFFILSPNETTSDFLDKLLWKFPKNSFLPHTISSEPCLDKVVISMKNANLNKAEAALNLTPLPLLWESPLKVIYELETPEKSVEVKQKFQIYRQSNFSISSM